MNRSVSVPSLASFAIVSALVLSTPASIAANYAADVLGYVPGTGAPGAYDQPGSTLGEPSRLTPGEFGGPVDPFSAPWQSGQVVSIGMGGSLTIRFEYPVLNLADNPHGLDFLIFGSAAFLITNGDYTGGGITDGSLFGSASGPTRIRVSGDGSSFFTLDPTLAPIIDGYFPTEGSGDFSRAVPPGLKESDFNGLGLADIRALYDGSGGGTGFDIGWARNEDGSPALLESIQFVQIDVLGDRAEIDAFSAVPEPGPMILLVWGAAALLLTNRHLRSTETAP